MYEISRYLMIRAILQDNLHISDGGMRKELFLRFYKNDFDLAER